MSQKKMLAGLGVLFVVILLGASFLYQKLGSQLEREALETGAPAEETTEEPGASSEAAASREKPDTDAAASEESTDAQKKLAPDLTVQDGDGNDVKLSDFAGTPVVVNFWASWCPPCKSEMPDFDAAYEEYGDTIQFMMVNLTDGSRETVETAKDYIEKQGYSFPVYYDTTSNAAITYGIMSVPATFFIDAEGGPIARATGAIDKAPLEKGIGMIQESTQSGIPEEQEE